MGKCSRKIVLENEYRIIEGEIKRIKNNGQNSQTIVTALKHLLKKTRDPLADLHSFDIDFLFIIILKNSWNQIVNTHCLFKKATNTCSLAKIIDYFGHST